MHTFLQTIYTGTYISLMMIQDRLQARMDAMRIRGASDLARRADVPQPTVHRILSGKTKNPDSDTVAKLAAALGTNADWLLTGNGVPPAEPQIVLWDSPEDLPQDDSRVWISRYDYSFSAGEGRLQWEVREKGALPFTTSFFKAIDSNPRNCKLMSVRGNSMEPFLFDKDLFMVDESKSTIKDGGIYALHFADDCYIKQVFKRPNGGLTLHSYNPAYPDREIQPDEMDAVSVIGKVIYRSGGGFTQ
ncbi:XRE family transcriptional regulator [Robbsia andropogonis]|uniref:XRE family transcriptional regulator n=1 Tax=Robbsia andropogonis TaxID=28092 RepID=UPI003D1A1D74